MTGVQTCALPISTATAGPDADTSKNRPPGEQKVLIKLEKTKKHNKEINADEFINGRKKDGNASEKKAVENSDFEKEIRALIEQHNKEINASKGNVEHEEKPAQNVVETQTAGAGDKPPDKPPIEQGAASPPPEGDPSKKSQSSQSSAPVAGASSSVPVANTGDSAAPSAKEEDSKSKKQSIWTRLKSLWGSKKEEEKEDEKTKLEFYRFTRGDSTKTEI